MICSSAIVVEPSLRYRAAVGDVVKGDIIVHYRSQKGIFAISRALEDGRYFRKLPKLGRLTYVRGWRFRTEYFILKSPIRRDEVAEGIKGLGLADGPILENGRVRQAHFMAFDPEGLRILHQASSATWPGWAEDAIGVPPGRVTAGEEGFFEEGEGRPTTASVRSARLREEAKRKYGLSCYCCGFNFEEFYGERACGRAIVHHLEMFKGDNRKGRLSTVNDVRVVCANCHYVIHLSEEPLDVDLLGAEIEKSWTRWSSEGVTRKPPVAGPRRSR